MLVYLCCSLCVLYNLRYARKELNHAHIRSLIRTFVTLLQINISYFRNLYTSANKDGLIRLLGCTGCFLILLDILYMVDKTDIFAPDKACVFQFRDQTWFFMH